MINIAYNVQCMVGHVFEAITGSEIETKCQAHAETHLDAFILGPGECPGCLEDERATHRRFANTCGEAGCPYMDDTCKSGCQAVSEHDKVGISPYEGQLRGLPAGEVLVGVSFNGKQLYV